MKIQRTQNTIKNIRAGLILRAYQLLIPFVIRTIMIYVMGPQYLGLSSLFTSILQVLNLAELGVGNAMVFAMYEPIAHDDQKKICALMRQYRTYYRIIGLAIGVMGLVLTPAIPHLISGDVPADINVYILYLLKLGATVLSYWLFAYKNCLLVAHQRTDVSSFITIITYTPQCLLQILALVLFKNYYLYMIIALLAQVLNNIITAVVVAKKYPQYQPTGVMDKEQLRDINQRIRDIFTAKVGGVVLKSSDSIVISAFLGLSVLAVYNNYFFVVSSITGIVEIILSSMMAGLGNSYVVETKEKNYKDLEKFTFMFLWVIGVCTCCFLGMYQPFMEAWIGPDLMLSFGAVICFAAYFFVYTLNRLLSVYKDAAGLWHQDRFCPLVTAIVNILLNLWWINDWGIYGVLLSTVVSMVLVGIPWVMYNLFCFFFDLSMMRQYVSHLLRHVLLTVLAGALVCSLCIWLPLSPWPKLVISALVSVVVPNVLFFVCLRKEPAFAQSVHFLDGITHHKLALPQRLLGTTKEKV